MSSQESATTGASNQSKDPKVLPSSRLIICHRMPLSRVILIFVLATPAVIVSSIIAWDGTVPEWEASILRFINGWPDWLEPLFWALQQFGVLGAPIIGGVIVVYFTRNWRHLLPFIAVLPLKLGIEKGIVKQLVQRERPFVSTGEWVNVRGPAFEGLSFPSGHTTTAFALGTLLMAFMPRRWRWLPLTLSLIHI